VAEPKVEEGTTDGPRHRKGAKTVGPGSLYEVSFVGKGSHEEAG